jgi:hypothetical protein
MLCTGSPAETFCRRPGLDFVGDYDTIEEVLPGTKLVHRRTTGRRSAALRSGKYSDWRRLRAKHDLF